jgi:surface polysaccharide O-acyltransferase-like enzyme
MPDGSTSTSASTGTATGTALASPDRPVTPDPASTAWLSWLRVVAICSVVCIHTAGYNAAQPGSLHTLRGQIARVLDFGSNYAVPVFVMVSGAMMLDPARFQGPGRFLRKRAARLVPPVAFWHAWYLVLVVVVIGRDLSVHDAAAAILNGKLYTALYFFWIVLGLSVVAPVLIPFIRDHGRRAALVAGLAAASIPVLTLATLRLRGTGVGMSETALTWWFPYLGFFLLGYGLRGVRLRGVLLWLATAGAVGLCLLNAWQWRNPDAPQWLQDLSPVGYYSATGTLFACLVFLAFQGHVVPGGTLGVLTGPRGVRLGRLLGDATLGVFALHLTVLYYVQQAEIGGHLRASPTTHDMLLRLLVVLAITWVVVLVLRKVPYVRALL